MGRTILDAHRILAATLLRGPHDPRRSESALFNAYRAFASEMGRSPEKPLVVGVGIYGGEKLLELRVLLSHEELRLDEGKLHNRFGPFDFPLVQVVTGPIVPIGRQRPAQGGDSLGYGQLAGATGTFGCLVKNVSGEVFMLSCNHVIAGVNTGAKGSDVVWQPGAGDGGTVSDRIGILHDFKPIAFGGHVPNDIDAAVARPDSHSDVDAGVRQVGKINGSVFDPPFRTAVKKVGWKSRLTLGTLWYKKLSFLMHYPGHGDALFENQYGVSGTKGNFAVDGDSGAMVLDEQDRAIGLLFATASQVDLTLANPVDPVLTYFAVETA